ncbi:ABC-type nitrate/sulfonate/bicarbonate transport system, permease component [Hoeflea sp. IMCC20628]|uniref:ABC transporter permease n=1 Tax=Hoeflea sp. IMCC20628 TaxID=1620421 RepID=UPI00063A8DFB|nr:ABC transporter permease [Hoeflea sp. IMCC20628]AKI02686.1 ABC-type nitrate/sulfonate/bicarbonate transport system, permease component [Hoeflea sp. IMCC20628]
MRDVIKGLAINTISIGSLIVIWYGVTAAQLVPRVFLPSPVSVWQSLSTGFVSGTLLEQTTHTVVAMLVGWFLCSLLGVVLGSIIGVWPLARLSLGPVLEIFRPMPPAAIIPVAVAIFGLSREMSLIVVIFGAIWPALLATVHGFSAIEPRLKEVGAALEMSPLAFVWKIALPNATPDIIAGMRLSMVISLVLVVITNMLTGQVGLGSLVVLASRTFDMAGLFAGLCLLAVIGMISNSVLQFAERRLLSYRQ